MKRIYFAHPVNVYDTELEWQMLKVIQEAFPDVAIENPNQSHHQIGYAEWKKRLEGDKTKQGGMSYYYDVVLPECDSCVGMPFLDGKFGAGVAGEMKFFLNKNQSVFYIFPEIPFVLEDTRIAALAQTERTKLFSDHMQMVLGVEETRARTWIRPGEYNKTKRPYEDAHRVRFVPEEWTKEAIDRATRQ